MKIIKAYRYANFKHSGQFRKYTNEPYIVHPTRCATKLMLCDNVCEDQVVAMLCHDILEDCDTTIEDLTENIGDAAKYVIELTNPSHSLVGKKPPRAERKRLDREHISKISWQAKRMKLIDRTDNLNDMALAPKDFVWLYCNESEALLEVLKGTDATLEALLLDAIQHRRQQCG